MIFVIAVYPFENFSFFTKFLLGKKKNHEELLNFYPFCTYEGHQMAF